MGPWAQSKLIESSAILLGFLLTTDLSQLICVTVLLEKSKNFTFISSTL
jgi:hypothetical protein